MPQTIGSIRVRTTSQPSTNNTVGAVRVAVNPGNRQRVQTVASGGTATNFNLMNANDLVFGNAANNSSVITYDSVTEKFVVQNVPRLNGGTF